MQCVVCLFFSVQIVLPPTEAQSKYSRPCLDSATRCVSLFFYPGSLLLSQFMVWGDVFRHREEFTIELALKKCSYSFGATLTKGILCNWLVCMAVWQGNAAQDVTGKLLGIWFPISAFVTMGFEHCIANQFLRKCGLQLTRVV
eukprot:GHUV01049174.1.p1 GENE.GHUV01049174.1~~GHUV01049174.1.p1  ORF type:complete len:143 (-),score=7.99 GHUV01049174.1:125-553(-)